MADYIVLGTRTEVQSQPTCLCGSVYSKQYLHRTLVLLTWGLASFLNFRFPLISLCSTDPKRSSFSFHMPYFSSSRALGSFKQIQKEKWTPILLPLNQVSRVYKLPSQKNEKNLLGSRNWRSQCQIWYLMEEIWWLIDLLLFLLISCGSLNKNAPHRLMELNVWSSGSGSTWEGFKVLALLEEVCHCGLALGLPIPSSVLVSLFLLPVVELLSTSPAPCLLACCHTFHYDDNGLTLWNDKPPNWTLSFFFF